MSSILGGIEILTLVIVLAIMTPVFNGFNGFLGRFARHPAAAAAGQPERGAKIMNYLATRLAAAANSAQARFFRGAS